MLATNHVLSGALIGALARRPALAFGAGVASHFVLDTVPHWGNWESRSRFLRVAVPDGLVSLAAMTAFTALAPADRRAATAAGMTGALLPDMNKPASLWFGRSPFPAAVDRFHHRIQHEASGRAHLELVAAAAFAAAALIALRGRGRVSSQPSDSSQTRGMLLTRRGPGPLQHALGLLSRAVPGQGGRRASQQARWLARRPGRSPGAPSGRSHARAAMANPGRAGQVTAAGNMLPADHAHRRVPEGALEGAGGRMGACRPVSLDQQAA
ncbi:MAG TPA: hypothetical protein VHS30_35665 [Streptosporangiaceae bacterium]|jgi:hypothetical protein|nr:hypothetical protein [Streptosporangiaceae bacterium]